MFVTIEIPAATKRLVERHKEAAAEWPRALARGVLSAATEGAESVSEDLMVGRWGVTAQHGEQGLAGQVQAWMIDDEVPIAALGVPANAPAAVYARILEEGGTITPRSARALSIPVSEEARHYDSPRDMPNLFMLKRPGRPPLLAEAAGRRLIVHWVLVRSVTIAARHWLERGVEAARPQMRSALEGVLNAWVRTWNSGGGLS